MTNPRGAEYWSARDLQPMPGYSQWKRFEQAVDRAISSCKQSGNNPDYHFAGAGKPIAGAVFARACRPDRSACAFSDIRQFCFG